MNKKRKNLKVLSSVLLGFLLVSGGALAMPTLSSNSPQFQFQESLKAFERNPEKFFQPSDLGLKPAFQEPFMQLNTEDFSDKYLAVNEGALEEALRKKDYSAWKKAVENLGQNSQMIGEISEAEFEILSELHNPTGI